MFQVKDYRKTAQTLVYLRLSMLPFYFNYYSRCRNIIEINGANYSLIAGGLGYFFCLSLEYHININACLVHIYTVAVEINSTLRKEMLSMG